MNQTLDLRCSSCALKPLGDPIDSINTFYDSALWQHRRLIVLGGGALLALGIIGAAAALMK